MSPTSEVLALATRRSRDFLRSLSPLAAALGSAAVETLDDTFTVLVDPEGIWLCPTDAAAPPALSIPWRQIGPLRDDWIPYDSPDLADVVSMLAGLPPYTEVNSTVLVVPVTADDVVADLRLTLVESDGQARAAERRRPRKGGGS